MADKSNPLAEAQKAEFEGALKVILDKEDELMGPQGRAEREKGFRAIKHPTVVHDPRLGDLIEGKEAGGYTTGSFVPPPSVRALANAHGEAALRLDKIKNPTPEQTAEKFAHGEEMRRIMNEAHDAALKGVPYVHQDKFKVPQKHSAREGVIDGVKVGGNFISDAKENLTEAQNRVRSFIGPEALASFEKAWDAKTIGEQLGSATDGFKSVAKKIVGTEAVSHVEEAINAPTIGQQVEAFSAGLRAAKQPLGDKVLGPDAMQKINQVSAFADSEKYVTAARTMLAGALAGGSHILHSLSETVEPAAPAVPNVKQQAPQQGPQRPRGGGHSA